MLIVAVGLPGCGGEARSQVEGKITYQGNPLSHAQVWFVPIAGPASAGWTSDDGTYDLFTKSPGDGFPSGSYKIAITPTDPLSNPLPIDQRYHNAETSGLTAEVHPGKNVLDFDIPDE